MLQRVLIIVLALYLIWRMLSAKGKRVHKSAAGAEDFSKFSGRSRERRMRQQRQRTEQLLPCSTCGTFVPSERALGDGGELVFCSELCREEQAQPPS